MTAPVARAEIERDVLAWIAEGALAGEAEDEARFERLALALFRYQYAANEPYRRICRAYGVEPRSVLRWRQIPPVPTGAFKEARLACFPPDACVRTFRTSGSSRERRGELHLDTLELYEASLLATFGAYLCPDLHGRRIRFAILAPCAADAPDSSLSYMFDVAVRELGTPWSRFYVGPDLGRQGWDPEPAIEDLDALREPVLVAGTAFAFVHLLDALAMKGKRLELPPGSRLMETGGFKGRSREVPREQLHDDLARGLGLPRQRIVNQYGMCELASQFYEPTLVTGVPSRSKRVPPWVRTRAVDLETLADVAPGEPGALVHYDLANTGSVLAVQTSDCGRLGQAGFEVLGRLPGAEARGCSIAADALLGAAP